MTGLALSSFGEGIRRIPMTFETGIVLASAIMDGTLDAQLRALRVSLCLGRFTQGMQYFYQYDVITNVLCSM
jgi:hypothetical protein